MSASISTQLAAIEAAARNSNLLSPAGAIGAAVGDVLAAAANIPALINTANAALSTFALPTNDPLTTAFSTGQPYGGAFITSPTITQMTPVDFSSILTASTSALAQLLPAQIAALAVQTGITIATDADLALAMAAVFVNVQRNLQLAFETDISLVGNINGTSNTQAELIADVIPGVTTQQLSFTNSAGNPVVATVPISGGSVGSLTLTGVGAVPSSYTTVAIPPLTLAPNLTALALFITSLLPSFPNIPGLPGVAASVWVDNLGVSVDSTGAAINGVPPMIPVGVLTDIATNATAVAAVTPPAPTNYAQTQNYFNTVVALAIDNGVVSMLPTLLASASTTATTRQVVQNRLPSVAQRGDSAMLSTLIGILGATAVASPLALMTTLITHANTPTTSSAALTTANGIVVPGGGVLTLASGMPIGTNMTQVADNVLANTITTLLATLGLTNQVIFIQNTCDSVMCGLNLINVALVTKAHPASAVALLDSTTVAMAGMFATPPLA